jgi:hypothetical protein
LFYKSLEKLYIIIGSSNDLILAQNRRQIIAH